MPRYLTILAIAVSYFVFAILLNSVGTVILQSLNSFDISKPEAATLEGFKDIPIALVSFAVASMLPRLGYRVAMMLGLGAVAMVCFTMPTLANFDGLKLLFATIGAAFALVKVSVYAIVGQLSHDPRSHSSLLNTVEGVFMVGVLTGYWIFSSYIGVDTQQSLAWLSVYYTLGVLVILALVCVALAPIQKTDIPRGTQLVDEFIGMLRLTYQPLVMVFVLSIFLYVLVEQGIGSWLPTFNNEVLQLPVNIAVQVTSVFALSLAVGRLIAGQLLRFVQWYPLLNLCLMLMGGLIVLSIPMSKDVDLSDVESVIQAPMVAFLLPLIGLFMAPVYPILNSVVLSALERSKQAAMTGLIVVFSALGGTTGSIITGLLFESFGGLNAFLMVLIPIAGIAITLVFFRRFALGIQKEEGATS